MTTLQYMPQITVLAWIDALKDDDDDFWILLDHDFQLALIQNWLWRNPVACAGRDRDELAITLVHGQPEQLFLDALRVIRRELYASLEPFLTEGISVGSRPRPVSADIEAVRVFLNSSVRKDGDVYVFDPGTTAVATAFLVRATQDGWRIVSVDGHWAVPGWPPVWEQISEDVID